MTEIVSVQNLRKTYPGGLDALKDINLAIQEGEILALLGPNGAGKTTLISTICGISKITEGKITVGGMDIVADYRKARAMIGLVPQEITLEPFETVINSIRFSRGLFGKPKNEAYLDQVLKSLSLLDKKDARVITLSGGMRRRVLIAKALSHEPRVLFLDEPTSGLDPIGAANFDNLTRDLKETLGLTVFLITHDLDTLYAICDRVAVLADQKVIAIGAIEELLAIDHPWINAYFSGPRGRAARRGHSDQNGKVRAEMQQRGRS